MRLCCARLTDELVKAYDLQKEVQAYEARVAKLVRQHAMVEMGVEPAPEPVLDSVTGGGGIASASLWSKLSAASGAGRGLAWPPGPPANLQAAGGAAAAGYRGIGRYIFDAHTQRTKSRTTKRATE